jgi:hypothetical protein
MASFLDQDFLLCGESIATTRTNGGALLLVESGCNNNVKKYE